MNPHPLLQAALDRGLLSEEQPLLYLFDLDRWEAALAELSAAFPANTLHALAVKANPLGPLLRRAAELGFGLEAASPGELALALRCAPPERVLLDSPCKTRPELAAALATGAHVNADNLQELAILARMEPRPLPRQVLGLRVNPVVGAGTVLSTSTAMAGSKFGVDLAESRGAILDAYRTHPWLRGLHVHVGSAGCDVGLLSRGVAAIAELAEEIEDSGGKIELLDIGGGMPVDPVEVPFAEYAAALKERAPALFAGRWRLATEFGRRVFARSGMLVSRVEYTKRSGGKSIAVSHLGADLLMRAVFAPDSFPLHLSVHGPDGALKRGEEEPWDLAGPLCFSGDLIARDRMIVGVEPGDLICVHSAGAYTLSQSTRYNSRAFPAIYGYRAGELALLRARQTEEEIASFWDP